MSKIIHLSHRSRLLMAVTAMLLLGGAWLGALSLTTQESRAAAWADSNIPAASTLEELAAFPEAYRARIVKKLRPEVKSRLWRDQIAMFLNTDPAITQDQRAYLERMMSRATPEAMRANGVESDICREFREVFPDHRVVPIAKSGNLGAFAVPNHTWRSRLVQAVELLAGRVTLHADEGAPCNCYNAGWCECSGFDECCQMIRGTQRACTKTQTGCGCFWEDEHECNGRCMSASACGINQ